MKKNPTVKLPREKQISNPFNMNNVTVISCAGCFGVTTIEGKVEPSCCPNCGSVNRASTRARYWKDGVPDYSVNLLKVA